MSAHINRHDFWVRLPSNGWGFRLLVGNHHPLFTERYGYMPAWHTRWFCLALLRPLGAK